MPELTEAQREQRRTQARDAIETRLRETWPAWRRPARTPNFGLAADLAFDSLGDLAAEILVDGTMMRSLTIKDGVATLELEEATEMVRIFAAGMRGCLDGHGASNYVEMEMTDGATGEAFTVTVQRRSNPTPHQFRQQAEDALATVMRIVTEYVIESNDVGGIDANDLVDRLTEAGFPLPEDEPDVADTQPEAAMTEESPVVAHGTLDGRTLLCLRHERRPGLLPIWIDDLDDGGICTDCGADVLIPQQAGESR